MKAASSAIASIAGGCLSFYAVIEVLAYMRWCRRVKRVEQQPLSRLSSSFQPSHWQEWFRNQMQSQPRPRELLETVFQAPIQRIPRERALHWICFYLTMRELESYEDGCYPSCIVDTGRHILADLEMRGQFKLHSNPSLAWIPRSTKTEAVNPNSGIVDFCSIGRGSINAYYKPLFVQSIITIARLYAERELKQMGFRRTVDEYNVVYWIRPAIGNRSSKGQSGDSIRPLFFMHGLGFGAVPYIGFIRSLLDDSRATVVPEWPNISLSWADNRRHDGLLASEYADSVAGIVGTLFNSDGSRATNVDAIAHSYGTIVMNYIHSNRPFLLARRVYIDAICFGVSFHKWVIFSAEYKMRTLMGLLSQPNLEEMFSMWFVKGDVAVQQLNKRFTFFAETMASHPGGDLNEHCLVVLSGKDVCIPTYDIYSYISNNNLKCAVEVDPEWTHGGFLFQPDPRQIWQKISDWVSWKSGGFRRVRSHPSLRGHMFAAGS